MRMEDQLTGNFQLRLINVHLRWYVQAVPVARTTSLNSQERISETELNNTLIKRENCPEDVWNLSPCTHLCSSLIYHCNKASPHVFACMMHEFLSSTCPSSCPCNPCPSPLPAAGGLTAYEPGSTPGFFLLNGSLYSSEFPRDLIVTDGE